MDSFVSSFDAKVVRPRRFQFLASLHDHQHVAPDIPLYRYLIESIAEKKAVLDVDVVIIGNDIIASEVAAYTLARKGKRVLFAANFPDVGTNGVRSLNRKRYSFMPGVVAGYVIRKLFPNTYEKMPYTAFSLRRTLFSRFPGMVDDACDSLAKRLVGASVIIVGKNDADNIFFLSPYVYGDEYFDRSHIHKGVIAGSMPKIRFPSDSHITKVILSKYVVFTSPPPEGFEYPEADVVKIGAAAFECASSEPFTTTHRLRDMAGALLINQLIDDKNKLDEYTHDPDAYV